MAAYSRWLDGQRINRTEKLDACTVLVVLDSGRPGGRRPRLTMDLGDFLARVERRPESRKRQPAVVAGIGTLRCPGDAGPQWAFLVGAVAVGAVALIIGLLCG